MRIVDLQWRCQHHIVIHWVWAHGPRSSSAVRESRFATAEREEREVERFVVVEATFCLAPLMGGFEERQMATQRHVPK
jgi:hypothetical protein